MACSEPPSTLPPIPSALSHIPAASKHSPPIIYLSFLYPQDTSTTWQNSVKSPSIVGSLFCGIHHFSSHSVRPAP